MIIATWPMGATYVMTATEYAQKPMNAAFHLTFFQGHSKVAGAAVCAGGTLVRRCAAMGVAGAGGATAGAL
ncbi:MAG: hypothetical protein AB1762_18845 [Gemmatimonadota bacterium]